MTPNDPHQSEITRSKLTPGHVVAARASDDNQPEEYRVIERPTPERDTVTAWGPISRPQPEREVAHLLVTGLLDVVCRVDYPGCRSCLDCGAFERRDDHERYRCEACQTAVAAAAGDD